MKTYKTYPLSPSGFSALRSRLLELGVTLPADTEGTLEHRGVYLQYRYIPGTLTLKIIRQPIIVATWYIWNQVDKWLGLASS